MNILKKLTDNSLIAIFLAAAFLRLFLAPFFFHPDLKIIFYNSHFLSQGIFNIYDYLSQNPSKAILGPFVYPPLAYFLFGVIYWVVNLFARSGFLQWLGMGNEAVGVIGIFRYLFLTKLPLFIFEFLVGFLLTKIIQDQKQKKPALILWFFNPVNIYVVVLMGQFDIVPAFLTVLCAYFVVKKKWEMAAIMLGIGAAVKTYPLLFLPFLVVASGKKIIEQVKILFLGLLPYLVTVLPLLGSKSFRESVLVSGLSQRMFLLSFPLGFGEKILVVLLGLVILFFSITNDLNKQKEKILAYFLAVILLILGGSHFHPQWFIWAMPFLVIMVSKNRQFKLPFTLLILGWLGVTVLFDDKFLTFGLFSPLDQGFLFFPPPRTIFQNFIDPNLVQSMFHTIFLASGVWSIYLMIFGEKNEGR